MTTLSDPRTTEVLDQLLAEALRTHEAFRTRRQNLLADGEIGWGDGS